MNEEKAIFHDDHAQQDARGAAGAGDERAAHGASAAQQQRAAAAHVVQRSLVGEFKKFIYTC